jgi:hypothetical protein
MARKLPKRRNPVAYQLITNALFRPKVDPTPAEKQAKRDHWNRNAKHKKFRDPE